MGNPPTEMFWSLLETCHLIFEYCMCACTCAHARVCMCAHTHVPACARVCMRVKERQKERGGHLCEDTNI